jgi:hypothetical protein
VLEVSFIYRNESLLRTRGGIVYRDADELALNSPQSSSVFFVKVVKNAGQQKIGRTDFLNLLKAKIYDPYISEMLPQTVILEAIQAREIKLDGSGTALMTQIFNQPGKCDPAKAPPSNNQFVFDYSSTLVQGARGDFSVGIPWVSHAFKKRGSSEAGVNLGVVNDFSKFLSKGFEIGEKNGIKLIFMISTRRSNAKGRFFPVEAAAASGFLRGRRSSTP